MLSVLAISVEHAPQSTPLAESCSQFRIGSQKIVVFSQRQQSSTSVLLSLLPKAPCGKLFPAPRADTQLLHITEIGTVHNKTTLQKEEKNYWNEGLGRSNKLAERVGRSRQDPNNLSFTTNEYSSNCHHCPVYTYTAINHGSIRMCGLKKHHTHCTSTHW